MGFLFAPSQDPSAFLLRLKEAAQPRIEELELVVEEEKTRILERTAAGVDFEGKPFAPYSQKGPYYYYPNGELGQKADARAVKRNIAAAKRFHAKINAGRGTPIGQLTPGGGIKFASYAEFKRALGRQNVDLMGPKAPLMLQSIVKQATGPLEVTLGIYDAQKAAEALAHNQGNPATHLPQRKWFAISANERKIMTERLAELVNKRLSASGISGSRLISSPTV